MKFNKVRLPLAASVSASDPLTFGPPEAGYTDMTSYDGFGWVPYMVTWGTDKYEIGVGSFASGVFTRQSVQENDQNSLITQAITTPATFMVLQTMQNSVAHAGTGVRPPVVSGVGSIAIGTGAQTLAEQSLSIGPNVSVTADLSVGILGDASEQKSVNINGDFSGTTTVGEVQILGYSRRDFSALTSNATPTVAEPVWPASAVQLVIPEGEIWYIKARIMATRFDTDTYYPLAAQVRSFSCFAAFNGMLGSLTATTDATFGTFTGTSTLSITAGGAVHFVVTGVAATEIQWSIAAEFQRLVDWNF